VLSTLDQEAVAVVEVLELVRERGLRRPPPRVLRFLVVAEDDVQGLADAIGQVYSSASLCQQLGAANRRTAEQMFSPANAARAADLLRRFSKGNQTGESRATFKAAENVSRV